MNPLASVSDFVSSFPDSDEAVQNAIEWATSVIANYCNRNFDLVTGDEVTISPSRGAALLPETPVANVTSVYAYLPDSVNGGGMAWIPLTNYKWVASTGILYDTTGLPGTRWTAGPSWPWLPGSLRVTYDHGYATPPKDLTNVCVRLAQQYLENPMLMVQRGVGDVHARFSGSAGVMLNALDKAILDRYANVGVA